ncbi:MAG TPA: glycosyl hydrolase, partial [Acidobacteriota bacterium]
LFAGTEFGVFFSMNSGKRWTQLKGGIPVIAVRDLAIQKRENDLVVATFGRGFYILDDITPLRLLTETSLDQELLSYPVKESWMFIPEEPLGLPEKSFQGHSFFTAPNPPAGAVFTYYLKEEIKTRKKARQEKEKELIKEEKDVFYPSWEDLREEDREEEPAIAITVTDEEGNVVRRITGPATAGFHRVSWDLRYPATTPVQLETKSDEDDPFTPKPIGPLAAPGTYKVTIAKRVESALTPIGESQSFQATALGTASLPATDRAALLEFQRKTAKLQRAVMGSVQILDETKKRLDHLKKALDDTPGADPKMSEEARLLALRLKDLQTALNGDPVRKKYNEPTPPAIADRVEQIVFGHWTTTAPATGTHRRNYDIAAEEFTTVLADLRKLMEVDLKSLEDRAEVAGAPWTPGRVPKWTKE